MSDQSILNRLGVCSWSLQCGSPKELLTVLESIGLKRIQVALDPLREQPEVWGKLGALAQEGGFSLVSGMFTTLGEDYSTLESIRRTGGVVPDETWEANWKNIQADAAIANDLGISLVSFHAGFLPHDPNDPDYRKLEQRVQQIAGLFEEKGLDLAFETGQETAESLRQFLDQLNRPNVGVNFDPANMILYDKGDPIEALKILAPHLKQCHIKDATLTRTPGTWGEEVCTGTGEVDWKRFFETLREIGYSGDLCIEREAGEQRKEDILAARLHVETVTQSLA